MSVKLDRNDYVAISLWQRVVLVVSLLFFLPGLVASGFFLVVNLRVILSRFGFEYAGPREMAVPEYFDVFATYLGTGQVAAFLAKVAERFEAMSLDLSAITPALLVWFFAAICVNLGLGLHGRQSSTQLIDQAETVPFFRRYQITWVQLGLIGTLYGFLLIGARMRSVTFAETEAVLDILLSSFGTALLSTFTAVLLAYAVGPVVNSLWRAVYRIPEPKEALSSVVDVLTASMKRSGSAMSECAEQLAALNRNLSEVAVKLTAKRLDSFEGEVKAMAVNNKTSAECLKRIEGEVKAIASRSETSAKQLEAIRALVDDHKKLVASRDYSALLESIKNDGEKAANSLQGLETTGNAHQTTLNDAKAALAKISAELETLASSGALGSLNEDVSVIAKNTSAQVEATNASADTIRHDLVAGLHLVVASVNRLQDPLDQIAVRDISVDPRLSTLRVDGVGANQPVMVAQKRGKLLSWWPWGSEK